MAQKVYDAFVDIWDREDLWVAIDRAHINPPKKLKRNQTASSTGVFISMRALFPLVCKVYCRSKYKISKQAVFRQSPIYFSPLRNESKHNL